MINVRTMSLVAMTTLLMGPAAAQAQGRATTDARWLGWIGCWQPAAGPTSSISLVGTPPTLCIVPTNLRSAVELVTVVDGAIASRERIDATGARVRLNGEGCDGWKSAKWSASGMRLYLRSEATCEGGLRRRATGMLSMVSMTEWVDVQSVAVGEREAVRVVRYSEVPSTIGVPDEIALAVAGRSLASGAARVAAGAEIAHDEIIDASANVDEQVVSAWLVEHDPEITLNARELVWLADAGVPDGVLDLVVALANRDKFNIDAADLVASALPESTSTGRSVAIGSIYDPFYDSFYDPFNPWYGYGRYGRYSRYGYGSRYSPYGYSPFGYGYYRPPVVVVVTPTDPDGEQPTTGRARAVNGRGYTRSRDTGGSASTRSGRSTSSRPASGRSTSSGSSASGRSSGSSSSGGARKAKPKTPPPGE